MNVKLNSIFDSKSREFKTNPIMAARYEPGMENGWSVYYNNLEYGWSVYYNNLEYGDGYRYFNTYDEAMEFYNEHPLQKYVDENGNEGMCECEYFTPDPVLYAPRHTDNIWSVLDASCPLPSDESHLYNALQLALDAWIIKESDGSVRTWHHYECEVPFIGVEYGCMLTREYTETPNANAEWLKSKVG